MKPELQEALGKGWKGACKAIFGQEIGELEEYSDYLKEAVVGKAVKSSFSGKDLWVASRNHCEGARFFDFTDEGARLAELKGSLDINGIKDIDSLLDGLRETLVYSGNKVAGNSKFVEHSDSVVDGMFIFNSSLVIGGKCQAYTYVEQHSEYAFGCTSSGQSANLIRCFYNNSLNRCFEVCATVKAADSYFCYNIWSCSDCMFSFNLRNKAHMIANVQLEKGQYDGLKAKLLAEITQELKKKKRLDYSIMDIANGAVA
jgi:hypothetical protein